ncbi:MAG: prolipoprotein diacylglyceryl transferase [Deltaproteobacteria bacterium]|jgi:phosphatidylglycerol:prolipoprotein diacylglycerol transferase|nr:prolipoprotein diacylglyceryl transferase [Deltaproteobacteria bacterium]
MAPVWDINPILFTVPGTELSVRYYGLIFALVFLGGFFLFYRQTLKAGGTANEAYDIILPGFFGLLLGARLGHVFFYNFDRFLKEPSWVFKVWEGGLASHGAAIGLALALIYYAKKHKLPILSVTDRFAFSAALGAGMVRLGNFFNSEIVGKITDGPFGVKFPLYDQLPPSICPARYPSQLVEFFMGFFILGVLFLTDRGFGHKKRPRGVLSAIFLILYFLGRFLVEFIKERQGANDAMYFSRGQLLSLPIVAFGLIVLCDCLRRPVYDIFGKPWGKKGQRSKEAGQGTGHGAAQGAAQVNKKQALDAYELERQKTLGAKKSGSKKGHKGAKGAKGRGKR